ncbi:unnamed protein product [Phyllotreta striolata]|uniref:FAM234A/B beta-propeller domain-containing protein n=1 Tax=Phyllotreta striolata TaxID=444603 RepID=A0A9N9TIE9_PHYSR|nr:unnamed protein product [Phyllotreta striolata]
MKVSAYTGMNLRGEVRESISLDEDDLSDVEDEVFIRDGKTGYKFADDLTVKRPLMATRRNGTRSEGLSTSRFKQKPICRDFCKPCCYVFAALSILIGLIIVVVVLVSIYPLPLDKLKDWLIKKSPKADDSNANELFPCDSLKVVDVWSASLPKLTTDSPVRVLDVNGDGSDDVIFGFGTGDNYNTLPPDIFCPVYMGVPHPCEGGIIALNGLTGDIIWRHWLNDTIFSVHCTVDVNGDAQNDCLIIGTKGTIAMVDTKNGTTIWVLNKGKLDVFVASFIPDQNNDSIPDIIASHSSLSTERDGHLVLLSGKTGEELKNVRTPGDAKIFYMPEILVQNNKSFVIFGTGSPTSGGNLTAAPFTDISIGVLSNATKNLYEDKFKGVLIQSVLVDITGDGTPDIITAMYNSTLVAINGENFKQIWNYTVPGPNPETNISPTPAYFNFDNVTDFLIIYQKYDDILNYNYTQTFIIDGKTGTPIYKPITGGVITQSSGLSVSLESHGYDMYLFWTSECVKFDKTPFKGVNDAYGECLEHNNNTLGLKLNALSQFHQPPGFVIYNSMEKVQNQLSSDVSAIKQLKEYYKAHSKIHITNQGQSEVNENYKVDSVPIGIKKYGSSSFRHKDRKPPQNYVDDENLPEERDTPLLDQDYDNYYPSMEDPIGYNPIEERSNNRDPRSKDNKLNTTKKKNLSESPKGIYDFANVLRSENRLLHDVDYVPTEILKDTYVKNEEMRLRKSRFEQRDVNKHVDKIKEKEEIQNIIKKQIEEAKKNESLTLWDLESEKEMKEWLDRQYRGKREANYTSEGRVKVTSVGAILDSINKSNASNSFDVVFITYWQPTTKNMQDFLQQAMQECIQDKFEKDKTSHAYQKTTDKEQRELFRSECLEEQTSLSSEFDFFNRLNRLKLGQMTVYRLRIECDCVNKKRCAKFLPKSQQSWPSYLGKAGDGVFLTRA